VTSILALDVTEQARTAGLDVNVAISAGVLASFKDGDEAARDAYIGALVRLLLAGPYQRTPLTADAEIVDVGGRLYVVSRRMRSTDLAEAFAIMSLIEAQLAGGDVDFDVRERIARRPECFQ
jgi:hypothetical protein